MEPRLAEKWVRTPDGRSLTIALKSGVTFHDGSPMNPQTVAALLPNALSVQWGPIVEDIDHITAADQNSVEIGFRRPSPLLLESLDVPIRKTGQLVIGTGPFMVPPNSVNQLRAFDNYHLGRPKLDEIQIETLPSVRKVWAELLRDRIDMLYEVSPEALDSLESSTRVAVFTFTRRYQFVVALNTEAPALRSSAVRRALNVAIDRTAVVRAALNGHGVPSSGPIWPRYWALQDGLQTFRVDPKLAAQTLNAKKGNSPRHTAGLHFTCLVLSDAVYERIALDVKRQLAAVGVDMDLQSVSQDQLYEAEKARKYEAVLTEMVSGPTLLRLYLVWHSKGPGNPGNFGNSTIDSAFDRVLRADDETAYRREVVNLNQAFADDPPAIFLAWSERARAVSKRFVVPAEPGRDILGIMRFLKPANADNRASRN